MMYIGKKQTGFSLVETLVAITILLVIIVGPMTLAANAARSTNFSSEQVVAFFLAQEGAELAQKARDDILLPYFASPGAANQAWNDFTTGTDFADCFDDGGGSLEVCGLTIDTDSVGSLSVVDCAGANINNCKLYYDTSANERSRYTHTSAGNEATIYTRTITMAETANQDIEIVSRVTWRTGQQRQEQSAQVVTYLYNVYGR